jgi:hypothetical protein
VIIPALDLSGKNSSISNQTAIIWLEKLGYTCKDIERGLYHDGHEWPDVVEALKVCLNKICQYEQ